MIIISNNEVYSDNNKIVHKIGTSLYFLKGIALPNEETSMYEEVDQIPTLSSKTIEDQILCILKNYVNSLENINNEQALETPDLFNKWESYINKTIKVGTIVNYCGELWKVRQAHTVLAVYPPSLHTASLYERINKESTGTIDDPIKYNPPMEIFNGKYYKQNDILYLCTRDSEQALTHNLSELIGLYVNLV